jgi:hypothetical protein
MGAGSYSAPDAGGSSTGDGSVVGRQSMCRASSGLTRNRPFPPTNAAARDGRAGVPRALQAWPAEGEKEVLPA